jgi:hypothetical protein
LTLAFGVDVQVVAVQWVTIPALCLASVLGLDRLASVEVDLHGHRLEVVRVYAMAHSTQMVDGQTFSDRSYQQLVGQAMGSDVAPI